MGFKMAGKHFKVLLISLGLVTAVISNKLMALQLSSILFCVSLWLGKESTGSSEVKSYALVTVFLLGIMVLNGVLLTKG
jgi:hypothetical protein